MEAGASNAHSEIASDHLVAANLRGVDSHGVSRIPYYIDGVKKGEVNVQPKIKIVKDFRSMALIDADYALGQIPCKMAAEIAMEKAKKYGIGVVGVRKTSHVGMLSYYGAMIANKKMAGLVFTNSPPFMAAHQGRSAVLGTNPICASFPRGDRKPPIVLDMATSLTAVFKIQVAADRGLSIPIGWALDNKGKPTTDAKAARAGALLPFGGHKGFGLAVVGELFSAVLVGGTLDVNVKPGFHTDGGLYLQAIDISHFRGIRDYFRDVGKMVKSIKQSGGPGGREILLPGERADATMYDRLRNGIPLAEDVCRKLECVSKDYAVPLNFMRSVPCSES